MLELPQSCIHNEFSSHHSSIVFNIGTPVLFHARHVYTVMGLGKADGTLRCRLCVTPSPSRSIMCITIHWLRTLGPYLRDVAWYVCTAPLLFLLQANC